jgi:hypothetical protein
MHCFEKLMSMSTEKLNKLIRFRFSLKSLLVIIVLLSTALACWRFRVKNHYVAMNELSECGASFSNGFEEPFGPNWFYNWKTGIPFNGFFPVWFSDRFCIKGYFWVEVKTEEPLSVEAFESFCRLTHLRYLSIEAESYPKSWATSLGKCRELEELTLMNAVVTEGDLLKLANCGSLHKFTLVNVTLLDPEGCGQVLNARFWGKGIEGSVCTNKTAMDAVH